MTDLAPTPLATDRTVAPGAADGDGGSNDVPRAGAPAPPGSFDGRARSFRQEQAMRRSVRRERIGTFLVVVILALGVYTILTARPYSPSSRDNFPTPGPPIIVTMGTPTGATPLNCSAGGTAYVERIPWTSATQPVATGDINLRVYEIWDGDYILDPNAVANVTPLNVCAGSPPSLSALWYAVLASPNGTNLLTYTVNHPWTAVTPGPGNVVIENGSVLTLVTSVSIADTGRGLLVVGYAGGSPIKGTVVL
ncbi:MAG: hypothetical protein WBW47_06240 [Thermoplasmata archaeon]